MTCFDRQIRQSWQKWHATKSEFGVRWLLTCIVSLALIAEVREVVADDVVTTGPDLQREQRMDAEIRDVILDGEAIDLQTSFGRSFLAIYTESAVTPARGTVIVLHGRGFHPDWPTVVHPLRVGLTEHGWNTLAIQLPVLEKEAKYFDYLPVFADANPRIDAAIEAARERSDGPVVLLAHSCGSHMAQHWMLSGGDKATAKIDAFVGISMGATDYGQPMQEPFVLDRLTVPVLDLYGDHDFPAVQRLAGERLAAIKAAGNPKSRQQELSNADHYYVDRQDALVESVAAWLDTL